MVESNKKQIDKLSFSLTDYVQKFNELSIIFDSMPTGVFAILDPNLNIATINKAASEILNWDSQMMIGKGAREIFESHFPGISKLIEETIKNHRPIKNFTLEIETRNAEIRTYLVSTALIAESEQVGFGIILVLYDISEVTHLRKTVLTLHSFGDLIGGNPAMKEVYSLIETVAQYDTTVLIYGETGTGKEVVARTIHERSHRSKMPFIPVSCSALSSTLLESELFGHVRGAFTGAIKDRMGRFEMANGGTIFLDEIGTLSHDIQMKLLRTIQERVIERVGSSELIHVNVRVISATNRVLTELITNGDFREDLYYRLKVFQINLPPLRERRTDIPLLADYFIERFNKLYNRSIIGLSPAAKDLLLRYIWPGNVRELENAIEHALVLSPGKIIESDSLPPEIRYTKPNGTPPHQELSI